MIDATRLFDGTISALGAATASAITTSRASTNVLDLLAARDMGAGHPLGIHVDTLVAFTAGGAATLTVELDVSPDNSSWFQVQISPIIPVSDLIQGAPLFRATIDPNQLLNGTAGVLNAPGRYLRLYYTVATGPMTAGGVFAYLNPREDRQQFTVYPKNYTALAPSTEV